MAIFEYGQKKNRPSVRTYSITLLKALKLLLRLSSTFTRREEASQLLDRLPRPVVNLQFGVFLRLDGVVHNVAEVSKQDLTREGQYDLVPSTISQTRS